MVLGDDLRMKALVGLASVEADAKATHAASYKDHWHERRNWPPASEETGLNPTFERLTAPFRVTIQQPRMYSQSKPPFGLFQCRCTVVNVLILGMSCRAAQIPSGPGSRLRQPSL